MKSLIVAVLGMFIVFNAVNSLSLSASLGIKDESKAIKDAKDIPNLSDADLEKMMKDYGLNSKDLGVLSSEVDDKTKSSHSENKSSLSPSHKMSKDLLMDLNVDDDPLKALLDSDKKGGNRSENLKSLKEIYSRNKETLKRFELTNTEAFNLIKAISKFQIFNRLPVTAMNIVNEAEKSHAFKEMAEKTKQEEMDFLISNTLNSQTFIDHENKVGRKGMLTIIDKDTSVIKQVWAVLNSKVFTFYTSTNHLKIVQIFRVSQVQIKNDIYSPCFFLYYLNSAPEASKRLICALNYKEKEVWLKTLEHHKKEYKR